MSAVQQQLLKIDRFLADQMLQNNKSEDEIQALRTTECVEIHVHGETKEMVTIMGLESRFQQQQEETTRINIPSTDILEWKRKFLPNETNSLTCSSKGKTRSNKRKQRFLKS